ncbi:MAG: glucosaminidase domain-containing protein [Fusobacteriaceae bacterium]
MKIIKLLLLFVAINFTLLSKTCDTYTKRIEKLAIENGVNPATAVVMFQLESSCGKSRISKEYNNFYGLRATQNKIKKNEYVKLKSGAQVATYDSLEDCFLHYADIMKKHYGGGYDIHRLKKYASDENYVTKINKAVKKYNDRNKK